MDFLYIIGGLLLLVLGGDWLLKSAVGMSLRLNIPKAIIGMTVVSFATSAPELIVSIKSAMAGFSDIALGNVIGSNSANIGLILGVVMLIHPMKVEPSFLKADWPTMMVASFVLFFMLHYDGEIGKIEGLVLFLLLLSFVIYLIAFKKNNLVEIEIPLEETMPIVRVLFFLALGGFGLWAGSELLISGAVNLAQTFGVSDRVIAVTIVAIGTSIPELAASVIAALKRESAISIGNIIGSNIFNILSVLGLTALIHPITISNTKLLTFDIIWMLAFSLVLVPLIFLPKKGFLDRKAGFVLVLSYVIFIYFVVK